ncbi:MAG: preprotein translocase subunit SecA [Candidatus Pacebacteria bacterium]|nr:preprotein translocase subunit SecA [Candidatus Paceibacterota bacterium]
MSFLTGLFDQTGSRIKELSRRAEAVGEWEPKLQALTDEQLAAKTADFRARLAAGETLDSLLPEAYATVRETSRRTLGQRHYDVQLIGGMVLHERGIAEMRTGEGKTLVATLPAYLNALPGKGVHVVTVNDYLARRDAVWMGQIYAFLGLSVGVLNNQVSYIYDSSAKLDAKRDEVGAFQVIHEFLRPVSRAEAYAADITYGTNNEFGFDYLRDNLAYTAEQIVGRRDIETGRYHFAIIDEVDSILIDESRTPLIISAPVAESESLYGTFAKIATQMQPEVDYTVDEKHKAIALTDDGVTKAEKLLGVDNIYTEGGIKQVHHLETAIRAKAIYLKDVNYVIKDGKIVIVDEFTGRLQPGRRWSEGLHQAIEAKEGVKVEQESRTFATVTLQNYFRLYEKLAGMTGTAKTSAEEFRRVYNLEVVSIPTHRENARLDKNDLIFQTEKGKWQAISRKVKELNEKGQPVLIGTVSIEKNELLSAYLTREGVKHEVLNAKNHEREGEVIAAAGREKAVTIATNLAGRGVDIKLGGPTPTTEEYESVKAKGGLFVLGTERHEARRIDNQLRGRSGRQGDPGETQFFLSLEDTLMRVFASDRIKNMMGRFGIPEDEAIENRFVSKALESAQEKIEGLNFDVRKHLLEYDDVTSHQRLTIYERRRQVLYGNAESIETYLEEAIRAGVEGEEEQEKVIAVLHDKRRELGDDTFTLQARQLILQVIDMFWVEHLEALEYLRGSVRLRAYGQRDPLVEFKREGLHLFKELEASIFATLSRLLPNLGANLKAEQAETKAIHQDATLIGEKAREISNEAATSSEPKVGRNDPCPCGSGKKYKKCHGA